MAKSLPEVVRRSIIAVAARTGQGERRGGYRGEFVVAVALSCGIVLGVAGCATDTDRDATPPDQALLQPAAGRAIEIEESGDGTMAASSPSKAASIAGIRASATTVRPTQPTFTPGASATDLAVAKAEPSATPTLRATPVQAAARATPSGSNHMIPGVLHTWQKWNNCGPSSLMMALSAFGNVLDQLEIAAVLKPDREDTNVSPEELADFVHGQGLKAIVRPNGDADIARALVAAGIPVIAEQWIDVDGRGEMGHYRVLVGYDNRTGEVVAMDSYYGANRRLPYAVLESEWRPFSGVYVAVYDETQAAALASAIGGDIDERAAWARAAERALAWTGASPEDVWSWFVLGEARSRIGDAAGSVEAFERANAIGLPVRAYWYQFGFALALHSLGEYERLIAHADATIATMQGENLEEWHTWRGLALAGLGRTDEARASFERALAFNPNHAAAQRALLEIGAVAPEGG